VTPREVGEMMPQDVDDLVASWRRYPTVRMMVQGYLKIDSKPAPRRYATKDDVDAMVREFARG
jgi:hypothetical protein